MTRKAIEKRIDQLLTKIAAAHGTDLTGKKGIEPEVLMVNSRLWEVLNRLEPAIVAATNPPAPAVPAGWSAIEGGPTGD